jgi:hypothetical protein
MRKLKVKKLELNRETLHTLEQTQLAAVDGGAPPTVQVTVCYTWCSCDTHNTCTTRFC